MSIILLAHPSRRIGASLYKSLIVLFGGLDSAFKGEATY